MFLYLQLQEVNVATPDRLVMTSHQQTTPAIQVGFHPLLIRMQVSIGLQSFLIEANKSYTLYS